MPSKKAPSEMIDIGKIIAPFGVRGEVKVYPYTDFPQRVYSLKEVLLEGKGSSSFHTIKKAFIHKNIWVITFEGCESREGADALIGMTIRIPSSERLPLPDDTYYFDEIIGLEVFTVGGEKLGIVEEILKTGGNDVYIVDPADEQTVGADGVNDEVKRKKIMLPALKSVVREINPEKGSMLVELPPGLLDL